MRVLLGGNLLESFDVLLRRVTRHEKVVIVVRNKSLHVSFVAICFLELLLCTFVDFPLHE